MSSPPFYVCAAPEPVGVDLRFRPREAGGARHAKGLRCLAIPSGTVLSVGKPGRGADIELHGAPYVSGRHAELCNQDGRWTVRDLGSREGTWVNRARVGSASPTVLHAGDELRFAGAACVVRERPEPELE